MAKKKAASRNGDRSDPKQNKSLAIRNVLANSPNGKASEIAEAVKKQFGHKVSSAQIYMIRAKGNMARNRRRGQQAGKAPGVASPMNSPSTWFEAITLSRRLLKATGSVENAKALLKAVDG